MPAVRALLLAGLTRLGDDRAGARLRDILRSHHLTWQRQIHPWEQRARTHALLAQHRHDDSLRWLRRRVHPLMAPHRRLIAAAALRRADPQAGTEAIRRIAASRW